MTLASTASKLLYNGDGSTTSFAVSFVFWQSSDIKAVHRDSGGTETVWTEGTHYTITGGGGSTGTLTVKTAPTDYTPAVGEKLLIKSALTETQEAALPLGGAFPSTTVERMVDIVTRLVQQHSEEIARSFIAAETDDDPGVLPSSTARAGKFLAFDAQGNAIASSGPAGEAAVSPFGATLVDDTSASAALTTLGVDAAKAQALGTAATRDTGTANGQVPVMDATGYPAADGSQITDLSLLLRGYIDGLILANNATDADHDLDIASGWAADEGTTVMMKLAATLTKRIDASWVVGTNQGGLDGTESVAGTPDADTWYHVWLIRRSDTGVVDALFSESATAPTLPASYDRKRRIGAVLTNGSSNILAFKQYGDRFLWDAPVLDRDSVPTAANESIPLSVPSAPGVAAIISAVGTSTANRYTWLHSPDVADATPGTTTAPFPDMFTNSTIVTSISRRLEVETDGSSQIRASFSDSTSWSNFRVVTQGWIDPRGRNA